MIDDFGETRDSEYWKHWLHTNSVNPPKDWDKALTYDLATRWDQRLWERVMRWVGLR